MNAVEKMKRLKRTIDVISSLKSAEVARQAKAISQKIEASKLVSDLDSIDPDTSVGWYLFPAEWLTFRAKLDKEISQLNASAEAAAVEVRRMEKVSDRLTTKLDGISAAHDEKKQADEMSDFITNFARDRKPALGKFSGIIDTSLKSRG